MKKILVITGSPRKNGNSTLLANAFIEGAETAGNEVMLFEAGNAEIKGCTACNTCFTKGTACSFEDDFNRKLVPMLENADMIVFSTPLYWATFSAQLKLAIDKLCAFDFGKKELKIKEAILMVCGATSDMADFKGIIETYEIILKYESWENRGILIVPNVNEIGDIKSTDWLEKAKNMGLGIG
jgi:multimeric flavodoxin WrbA